MPAFAVSEESRPVLVLVGVIGLLISLLLLCVFAVYASALSPISCGLVAGMLALAGICNVLLVIIAACGLYSFAMPRKKIIFKPGSGRGQSDADDTVEMGELGKGPANASEAQAAESPRQPEGGRSESQQQPASDKDQSSGCRRGCLACLKWGTIVVIAAICITVAILAAISLDMTYENDLPMRATGNDGDVIIEFGPNDEVHVTASSFHDALYGQGMATAKLRLFQLELQRLISKGRLSSMVGSAGVDIDKYMHTLGIPDAVERAFYSSSPQTQEALRSYYRGVNDFLATTPYLPFELALFSHRPKPFQEDEYLGFSLLADLTLAQNFEDELPRFGWMTEFGLSWERVSELSPSLHPDFVVPVLDPEDVCDNVTSSASDPEVFCESPPDVVSWLNSFRNAGKDESSRRRAMPRSARTERRKQREKWLNIAAAGVPRSGSNRKPGASNSWVVSGNLTDTGGAFLANDPHLGLTTPSIWIQIHLKIRGDTESDDIIGAAFVGLPAVLSGRNKHISWGVTNTGVDVSDVYVLTVNDDGTKYWYNGVWKDIEAREIKLKYDGKTNRFTVRVAPDIGPIVTDNDVFNDWEFGDVTLALRWTSTDPRVNLTSADAFFAINRATNWNEFLTAVQQFNAPSQNLVYADREGNVGYAMSGYVPVRVPGHTGLHPVPGNGSYEWVSFLPTFDNSSTGYLPYVYQPKRGYIATANQRVLPSCFEYHLSCSWSREGDTYRGNRIYQMLNETEGLFTLDRTREIQLDVVSLQYDTYRPILEACCSGQCDVELSSGAQDVCDRLLSWDANMTLGSKDATLFSRWYRELARFAGDEIDEKFYHNSLYIRRALEDAIFGTSQVFGGCGDQVTPEQCKQWPAEALNTVAKRSDRRWGLDIHKARFSHLVLDGTPFDCFATQHTPHPGGEETVNVAHMDFEDGDLDVTAAASYRQLIDMSPANANASLYIVPPGQSGSPFSDSFGFALDKWSHGEYFPMIIEGYDVTSTTVVEQDNTA